MTLNELLPAVKQLSDREKRELIEAVQQMLQEPVPDETQRGAGAEREEFNAYVQAQVNLARKEMAERVAELLSRPNPTPDQIMRRGMFAGRIPSDEMLFKLAEWHPSDEEMVDG